MEGPSSFSGTPGEMAAPLRCWPPRWDRCRCAPMPRIGNVLPRGRAVVDLPTASGVLISLRTGARNEKGPCFRKTLFLLRGAPGEIRTPDLLVRSQTLYPTELRARETGKFSTGGERGIRTLEGLLTLTPLAGARLRPLGHLSVMQRAAKDRRPERPRKAGTPGKHHFSIDIRPLGAPAGPGPGPPGSMRHGRWSRWPSPLDGPFAGTPSCSSRLMRSKISSR